jgi:hypothetical protein
VDFKKLTLDERALATVAVLRHGELVRLSSDCILLRGRVYEAGFRARGYLAGKLYSVTHVADSAHLATRVNSLQLALAALPRRLTCIKGFGHPS